ncbi:MAG: NAD(P)/FAD-dependent oxidoreductase [Clostridiaceae bacterium]|nr:NAD(P)/FAD-dependent oxidoreductase [Clostridiaceae bacterium]
MYDAVIIGAGMGGLAAALELSLSGKKVILIEQRNIPGGLATSIIRGRFEFEATLHGMQGIGPKENPKIIRQFLEEAGVDTEFISLSEAYRLIIPKEDLDIVIPCNSKDMIDVIEREVPGSKIPLTKLMELCDEIHDSINYFSENEGRKNRRKLKVFTKRTAFFRTAGYTADEVIKKFHIPKKALHIIYPYWLYLGVPLEKVSFTTWASMMADYFSGGAAVLKHNSYGLSLSMEKRIKELGSTIKYNTRVEKILVESGKVTGIVTDKNETIKTNYVISSAYPNKVYGSMIYPKESISKEAYKLNNARFVGSSAFCVFIGLDVPPEELNINNYSYFVSNTVDSNEIYENSKNLAIPKYYTAVCLNKIIPDCTPKGTTQLSIAGLQKGEAWEHVTPENYNNIKREISESMIKNMGEVLGVNLFEHIEEIETVTPVTIARHTGSWNGSMFGYEHRTWDSFTSRLDSEEDEKFVKGLEFAGAHASTGNGFAYCIKSGKKAANTILTQMSAGR